MPKRRRNKPPRVGPSRALERRFEREYTALIDILLDQTLDMLVRETENMYAEAGVRRTDSWLDTLDALMARIEALAQGTLGEGIVRAITSRIAREVGITTAAQTRAQVQAILGIDVFREPATTGDVVDAFVRENVNLIKSVRETLLTQVEGVVSRSVRSGVRNEDLRKELQERFEVSKSRARLIARDQVNKLNGQLTKARHEALGVTEYIWRNVGDERVRPEHVAREGRRYSYDNPPADGNPGQPIQCRCWAEPIIPDFEEESPFRGVSRPVDG